MNFEQYSGILKKILDLSRHPVAVKFCENAEVFSDYERPSDRRYCQALMEAGQERKILLSSDNISCPAAAWALGFNKPPEKLSSGEMPVAMGIFGNPIAVRNTLNTMVRLEMNKYSAVVLCPLVDVNFTPDVVVIESVPEHLMWISLAYVFEEEGRLNFDTGILQATCVDVTIAPFVRQRLNASLGCYGCREATDLSENECILGFPIKDIEIIVRSLGKLNQRALPRVRNKTIYKALLDREK